MWRGYEVSGVLLEGHRAIGQISWVALELFRKIWHCIHFAASQPGGLQSQLVICLPNRAERIGREAKARLHGHEHKHGHQGTGTCTHSLMRGCSVAQTCGGAHIVFYHPLAILTRFSNQHHSLECRIVDPAP